MTPPVGGAIAHRNQALWRHYRAADYIVGAGEPFVLHVDRPSHALRALHRSQGVANSAFLTAWNPFSRRRSRAANDRAQHQLVALVRRRGYATLPGLGTDPADAWPGEESVLVLGMPAAEARVLALQFGQNALLAMAANAVPRLVWVGGAVPVSG